MPDPDTIRLILVVIAGLSFLAMLKKPFYGLVCYLIIMMTRPGLNYPTLGEYRVEFFVGIIILVIMMISPGRLQKVQLSKDDITKWVFILFGVMFVSMLQAFDFDTSWQWMYEFSKVFFFFLMIITLMDTEKDIQVFLWVFGIVSCFIGYEAIYNYSQGIVVKSISESRIDYAVAGVGMGSGHVALANLTLQGMPVLWYLGICEKKVLHKIIGLFLFLVCIYAVVISGSRGGFAGLVALWLCMILLSKHRLPLIGLGILSIFIIPLFSNTGYMNYISNALDPTDVSSESRWTGLRNGIDMLIRRPILGVGPGCYPVARRAWFGWGLWAHNHYGELMGDLGIIGTVVWFIFLKKYFLTAWNIIKTTSDNAIIKSVCYAVVVTTLVRLVLGMGTHSVYVFIWYMMAGVVVVANRLHPVKQEVET